MSRPGVVFGSRRMALLGAAGLASFVLPIVFGAAHATPPKGQSQTQGTSSVARVYKFDVASIKPNNSVGDAFSFNDTSDGLSGKNVPLALIIRDAFGVYEHFRISGAPSWLNSEKYDIEAKMDRSVVDELQKLGGEQRTLARQHMLQALLAERFKLTFHRETKEFPVYLLVVAKNGPKLQESKPSDADPNGWNGPVWGGTLERMTVTLTAKRMPLAELARRLSTQLDRIVLDKTGLSGKYNFTLKFTPDDVQLQNSPGTVVNNQAVPAPPDPAGGPTLYTAIQDQLGLKLESGKGPVEIIVIDHIERPSGN